MLSLFLLISVVSSAVFADTKKTPIKTTAIKDVKLKILDTKMTFNDSSAKTPIEKYKEKHPQYGGKKKKPKTAISSGVYGENDITTASTHTYDARKVQNQIDPVKGSLADRYYGPRRK